MSRVLIAGCGDLGVGLAEQLSSEGYEFFGLRRNPDVLPALLHGVAADLNGRDLADALPTSVDWVFYTATPSDRTPEAYHHTYVTGVENLLAALAERNLRPRRLFYVSSTSVYGQNDGSWVDEWSSTEPASSSGQSVLAGEGLVLKANVPATSIRFGGIYGRGRSRLLNAIAQGAQCVEHPPHFTNRIHRDDCVGVLARMLTMTEHHDCYVAVDDRPAAQCEVFEWLAERTDSPRPRKVPRARNKLRTGSKRCSNARLRATGFRFIYSDYQAGYAAMLGSAE